MAARPPPIFVREHNQGNTIIPFEFYNSPIRETRRQLTIADLTNNSIQPYDTKGREVIIRKLRPNLYRVIPVENQNNFNENLALTPDPSKINNDENYLVEVSNVESPYLLPNSERRVKRMKFTLPTRAAGKNTRKHRKQSKRRNTRRR